MKLTRDQLESLKSENPIVFARYIMANGGFAAFAGEAAEPTDPHADPLATYEALKATNPVAAAAWCREKGLL